MQYGNNGITSKKNGYAEIITADFYRRNAKTVINSQKSIPLMLKTRLLPAKTDRLLKEDLKINVLELRKQALWTKTTLLLLLPLQLLQQLQTILPLRTRILRRKRSQELFY